jgi:drug/metabolite transporter (DMT)-like permease
MSLYHGIYLRIVSIAFFSAMAICVRAAAQDAAVGQVVTFRGLFALFPLCIYAALRGDFGSLLETKRATAHFMRALVGGFALFLTFVAYANLPLAIATAIGFLTPVFSVLMAALVLRERPSPLIVVPLGLAIAGVGWIIPGTNEALAQVDPALIGVASGLLAAVLSAWAFAMIKDLTRTESPSQIAIFFSALLTALAAPTWMLGWPELSQTTWLLMVGAGILGGLGHVAMTEAFCRAPVASLAVYEFTALIWALLADIAIFAVWPDATALVGTALILAAAAMVPFLTAFRRS